MADFILQVHEIEPNKGLPDRMPLAVQAEEFSRAIEELCARHVDSIVILISLLIERSIKILRSLWVDLGPELSAVFVDQDRDSRIAIEEFFDLAIRTLHSFVSFRAAKACKEGWFSDELDLVLIS